MNPYLPLSIQTLTGNSSAPVTQPMPTNAPGAMQYANGASATMVPPTIPTPSNTKTQAPVTTTSLPINFQSELNNIKTQAEAIQSKLNDPTVGQTFNNAGIDYSNIPTYDELYGGKIDENKVRRQQAKLFQREIDATNQVYDQLLRDARQQNLGSLGSQRAMAARGGLLGSDFGAAQEQKVQQQGNEIIGALQAERTAKIGAIQGNVRKAVADELTRMRTELQTGAKNKLDYMALETEMKTKNARRAAGAFLTQGIDPSTLAPEELATIGAEAGLSPTDIIAEYNSAVAEQQEGALKTRKTEAEIKKIEVDIAKGKIVSVGEGTMLYNTETGEVFENPENYAPGTGGGSSSLSLTREDKQTLLGGGWSEGDISTIEADVRAFGLTEVVNQARASGATQSQINAIQKAYGASADTNQFLTKDYFRSLFGADKLAEAAQAAGTVTGGDDYIPFNESGDTEAYLNQLEATVNLYREAGFTDKEILNKMQ